jgi:hypothetical protein
MSIPRHEYDRAYLPIPDAPQGSMLDIAQLPSEVQDALRVCREYEAEGAYNATLIAPAVRAWFRYLDRLDAYNARQA